jgi:hypothetical protein
VIRQRTGERIALDLVPTSQIAGDDETDTALLREMALDAEAPACLPIADCASAAEAFRMYIWGMTNWIRLARHGETAEEKAHVPPVDLPLTNESADWLERKLQLLTLHIEPIFEADSDPLVQ